MPERLYASYATDNHHHWRIAGFWVGRIFAIDDKTGRGEAFGEKITQITKNSKSNASPSPFRDRRHPLAWINPSNNRPKFPDHHRQIAGLGAEFLRSAAGSVGAKHLIAIYRRFAWVFCQMLRPYGGLRLAASSLVGSTHSNNRPKFSADNHHR
jgi:hypothetical protein